MDSANADTDSMIAEGEAMRCRFIRCIEFISIPLCLFCAGLVGAADLPPQNHVGGDVTLHDGDRIWGLHTGVRVLDIPSTSTATVRPYDPAVMQTGFLEIHAETVLIRGEIDALGAGYTGGGGGAGSYGESGLGHGLDGTPGEGRYPGFAGRVAPEGETPGDGPAGGTYPHIDGGYDSEGSNTDLSTDTFVLVGSGGRGGYGRDGIRDEPCFGPPGGGGGGGGGCGGGYVRCFATLQLAMSGRISTQGATGQNGKNGHYGGCIAYCECVGGSGGDGGSVFPFEEGKGGYTGSWWVSTGGDGGAGAGGGILLLCPTPGGLTLTGTLDARGGRNQLTNGGTIKVFFSGDQPASGTLLGGRVYYRNLETLPLPPTGYMIR